MINRRSGPLSMILLIVISTTAHGRIWTDATGSYTVEADLVAFSDTTVVLQREDGEMVAVPIEKLSQTDQEFLETQEAAEIKERVIDEMQTWVMRDGTRLRGRIVDYTRRDMTLQRRRGRIYVNDRVFENLPQVYQFLIPRIVAEFEQIRSVDKQGLESWLVRQRGQPRTFTLEGVVVELEHGDEYAIPFFFFSQEDLQVLEPGWHQWLAAHRDDDYEQREEHAFLLRAAAAARHRDQQVQRQIALLQLQMQAVQVGVTSLWEVTLYPARGTVGPPLWVVVPGRNSAQATANALSNNPGYIAGPVRKVAGI